jgi:hypothetical protein
MARTTGTTLAVPRAALTADGRALAFEPLGFPRLAAWLGKIERLPADARTLTPAISATFVAIDEAVHDFGTPAQLAALPDVTGIPARPQPSYLAFVWTIGQLHAAARDCLRALHLCLDPGTESGARRAALQDLGAIAARSRDHAAALLPEIQQFRSTIVRVNMQFDSAVADLGTSLQAQWEAVGAQRARLENLQGQLRETGILHPHRRHELAAQIGTAEQELHAATAGAERLRMQAVALNELSQDGAWLDTSLCAMADFLQSVRAAWATFGAAMTQLSADAGADQLAAPGWLGAQLGTEDALPRWRTLAHATDHFCVEAQVQQLRSKVKA